MPADSFTKLLMWIHCRLVKKLELQEKTVYGYLSWLVALPNLTLLNGIECGFFIDKNKLTIEPFADGFY